MIIGSDNHRFLFESILIYLNDFVLANGVNLLTHITFAFRNNISNIG